MAFSIGHTTAFNLPAIRVFDGRRLGILVSYISKNQNGGPEMKQD